MAAGLDVLEAVAPARIDLDGADRLGFAGVLRAVLALFPGRVDAADEIEAGIGLAGQLDRLLAVADAESRALVLAHGSLFLAVRNASNERFNAHRSLTSHANATAELGLPKLFKRIKISLYSGNRPIGAYLGVR